MPVDLGCALQRTGSIFTADNLVITADSATGRLSAADVKSTDRSTHVLVTLGSGLRGMRTEGGQGGGPICCVDANEQRTGLAIQTRGGDAHNVGVRITDDVFDTLSDWVRCTHN